MTIPAYIHQALIPLDAPPRPLCGDSGPSAAHAADVTCPACLDLAANRKARTEVHDTHAIPVHDAEDSELCASELCGACATPADDEIKPVTEAEINPGDMFRDRDDDEWVAVSTGHEIFLVDPVFLYTTKQGVEEWGPLVKYDFTEGGPVSEAAATLARLSDSHAPAKTHDLSIRREFGNVVVGTENGEDRRTVYLPEGVARDLGRVLAPLTAAQRLLLIGDLMGGQK